MYIIYQPSPVIHQVNLIQNVIATNPTFISTNPTNVPVLNSAVGNVNEMVQSSVIRRPLNNVDNDRENLNTMHNHMFNSWEEWWGRWRNLKSSLAMEEIRARSHFYRCMSFSCPYTTSNDLEFHKHLLESHQNENIACSYCLRGSFNAESLIKHTQKHLANVYQCPRCIYRASSSSTVLFHLYKYHDVKKVELIWQCSWTAPNKVFQVSHSHLKPFQCKDCSFKSLFVEEFGLHQAVHPSMACFECQLPTNSFNDLLQHVTKHNIHVYHCHHCSFGSGKVDNIIQHICICHPEEPLKYLSRLYKSEPDQVVVENYSDVIRSENRENELNSVSHERQDCGNAETLVLPIQEEQVRNDKQNKTPHDKGQTVNDSEQKGSAGTITCPLCNKPKGSHKEVRNHIMFDHHRAEINICIFCNVYFESNVLLERHINHCHLPKPNQTQYICVFCNHTSDDSVSMAAHLKNELVQGKGSNDQRPRRNDTIDFWISNYLKAQERKNLKELVPNKIDRLVKRNGCPMCIVECSSSAVLLEHLSEHMQYRPYKCTKCEDTFPSHEKAIHHSTSVHSQILIPYQCQNLAFIDKWIMGIVFGKNVSRWPMFYCGKCHFKKRTIRVFLKHFQKEHPGCALDIRDKEISPNPMTTVEPVPVTLQENIEESVVSPNDCPSEMTTVVQAPLQSEDHSQPSPSPSSDLPNPEEVLKSTTNQIVISESQLKEREPSRDRVEARGASYETTASLSDSEGSDNEHINLECSLCPFRTPDLEAFKDHCKSNHKCKEMRTKHEKSTSNSVLSKKRSSESLTSVKSDTSSTSKRKSSKKHLSKSLLSSKGQLNVQDSQPTGTKRKLTCPLCSYEGSSPMLLSYHMKKIHSSSKTEKLSSDNDHRDESDSDERKEKQCKKRSHSSGPSRPSTGSTHKKFKRICMEKSSDDSDDKESESSDDSDKGSASSKSKSPNISEHSNSKGTELYWSNYGKKPKPVNYEKIFVRLQSPLGGEPVRLSLLYYRDMFFVREPRVVLCDYQKSLLF